MAIISNSNIARAIYLISRNKSRSEQVDISKKVVGFLFKKRLLSKAKDIILQLEKIINHEEDRIIAKVSSAEKLNHQTKTHLEHTLKKRYSAKEIVLVEKVDEELLGGLKVEINDEVIDFSIKNKIGKLQEYLTREYE